MLTDTDEEGVSGGEWLKKKRPRVSIRPSMGPVQVQVPEHASLVLAWLTTMLEAWNCLQERQTVAFKLLAGSIDRLVSFQCQKDSGRQDAWSRFGSGSVWGPVVMEVDENDDGEGEKDEEGGEKKEKEDGNEGTDEEETMK